MTGTGSASEYQTDDTQMTSSRSTTDVADDSFGATLPTASGTVIAEGGEESPDLEPPAADAASNDGFEQPTSPDHTSPSTDGPVVVPGDPVDVPIPPASRFVGSQRAVELLTTAGGADPTEAAIEILASSGPLGEYLATNPVTRSRLQAALDGARLVSAIDYADRITAAVNSTLDTLAADHAQAGTGLCLVVGPGPTCDQVADLNYTFSATPQRWRVDEIVDRYGSDSSAQAIGPIADLHFTGNMWNLVREAHNVSITAELRNAWIVAGAEISPSTTQLTANLVFLSAYVDAARAQWPDTWTRLIDDGVDTHFASTWNRIVDAYATTDSAFWNVAFLHDTSAVQEFTGGAAGIRRAPT
ncbi:MAG: hypothetical protein GY925_09170 [Actinomycetia bacterium]|nr:hypothetical protein [Actinomycetes bacterium]